MHVPYGYKIEDGVAVIDEPIAETIRALFQNFIECKSMMAAAKAAKIEKTHSVIGRIIKNKVYIGTDYYPQMIDEETFYKAQDVRNNNARSQKRLHRYKEKEQPAGTLEFRLGKVEKRFEDPYQQAQYVYSQIQEVLE